MPSLMYVLVSVLACAFKERYSDPETVGLRWHSTSCKCKKAAEGSLQSLVYGLNIQYRRGPLHPVAAERKGAEN